MCTLRSVPHNARTSPKTAPHAIMKAAAAAQNLNSGGPTMNRNHFSRSFALVASVAMLVAAGTVCAGWFQEYKSGIIWPEPKVIEPGSANAPPADAIVLFDGKDLSKWTGGENWEIKDGYAITRKAGISTKDAFGDCQLHLEFATPSKVEGSGQGRGNSGVYMMGRYEIQILDSYDNTTYFDGQC